MTTPQSLVLLSGGLESTLCVALVAAKEPPPIAVTFDYGQLSVPELGSAQAIADHYGCEHLRVALEFPWSDPPLSSGSDRGSRESHETPPPRHYVPGRNLMFLSIAVAIAEMREIARVYLGATIEDRRYPDTQPDFIQAFTDAALLGLQCARDGRPIAVRTPLAGMQKRDVIRAALNLAAPLELTWSCYAGGAAPCGECGACSARARAFDSVGFDDPAVTCFSD